MRRIINRRPGRGGILFWSALPFLAACALYAVSSALRLAENPNDKLLPPLASMFSAIGRMAFAADPRTGDVLFWADTLASLQRLGLGLGFAMLSLIPPMAVLPVLFIVFGLDELSKVVLIVIGVTPFLIRDLALRVGDMPREQLIKAQTLGASTWQIVVRVVVPQMLPRLADALRLSLGPAWLFLISAEAIAATEGLGYRIFLVRRYMAMDVILPYVAWITFLAFLSDFLLRWFNARCFPWLRAGKGQS
jgi:NitT/TauT family transport system permease protein